MAISPGTYNVNIQRRSDWSVILQFKDSTDTAINLLGYTVYAQAWDKARSTKYADFGVAYTDRSNGKVTISLTDAQTATFIDEVYYDVMLENGDGLREYYLEGVMFVSQGYTSP
jgi:hypothetical protein|tara:strand:- start:5 stop:346 length:342 start_codon:yes stop_codon:yes gene_type:complete